MQRVFQKEGTANAKVLRWNHVYAQGKARRLGELEGSEWRLKCVVKSLWKVSSLPFTLGWGSKSLGTRVDAGGGSVLLQWARQVVPWLRSGLSRGGGEGAKWAHIWKEEPAHFVHGWMWSEKGRKESG